jgi:magnesium-transporting ATPase (P-type)
VDLIHSPRQAYFVCNDLSLYDECSDTPASVHNSGMCADLGQVQYVLSDKTGTITQNCMKLRRCCVLDRVYGKPIEEPGGYTGSEPEVPGVSFSSMVSLDDSWSDLADLSKVNSTLPGSLQDRDR